MKSLTAVCQTAGASMPAINPNGRAISRHHHHPQRENAEMKMYLSKLKDLVPFMPKNRKLSKLEIIQHVIDYICDLQSELETHPEMGNFDAASALNFVAASQNAMQNPGTSFEMDADDFDEDEDALEGENTDVEAQQIDADDDALTQRLSAEATAASSQQQRHQWYQHQMQQQQQRQSSPPAVRQPLMDRQAPNTILPAAASSVAAHSASHGAASTPQQQQQQQQHQLAVLMMTSSSQATSAEKHSRTNSC